MAADDFASELAGIYERPISAIGAPVTALAAAAPLAALNPFAAERRAPIVPKLPDIVSSFNRKWQGIAAAQPADPALRAVQQYDAQRVTQGKRPLTLEQTARAYLAVKTGEVSGAKDEDKGFWGELKDLPGNIIEDVGEIAMSLPQLPAAALGEITRTYRSGQAFGEALTGKGEWGDVVTEALGGESSGNLIKDLTRLPLVDLVPGAYTIGNIASGDVTAIAENPLISALDVLPIAGKVAKGTAVGKAAAEAGKAADVATAEGRAAARLGRRPLRAVVTRTLDEEGNLVPNVVGRAGANLGAARAGQALRGAFGSEARELARLQAVQKGKRAEWGDPDKPLPKDLPEEALAEVLQLRASVQLGREFRDLTPEQIAQASRAAANPLEMAALDARQLAYVARAREIADSYGTLALSRRLVGEIGGELYPVQQARRLLSIGKRADEAAEMAGLRRTVEAADQTPATYVGQALEVLRRPARTTPRRSVGEAVTEVEVTRGLSDAEKLTRARGLLHAADVAGADVSGPVGILRKVRTKEATLADLEQSLASTLDEITNDTGAASTAAEAAAMKAGADAIAAAEAQRVYEQAVAAGQVRPGGSTSAEVLRARQAATAAKAAAERSRQAAEAADRGRARPAMSIDEIRETLKPHLSDPLVRSAYDAIGNGDLAAAARTATQITRRGTYRVPAVDAALDSLRRLRGRDRFVRTQLGEWTDTREGRYRRLQERAAERAVPARFQPLVRERTAGRYAARYTADQAEQVTAALLEGRYGAVDGFDNATRRTLEREVATTWRAMRDDEGLDPMFVHQVDPSRARRLNTPRISEMPVPLSQVKARSGDVTPYIDDLSVALTHQGLEFVERRLGTEFGDVLAMSYGKGADELVDVYTPAAQAAAARDPRLPVDVQAEIRREWVPFDPQAHGYAYPSRGLERFSKDADGNPQIWIPRHIADNLERMRKPTGNALTAVMDPITNMLRTSVLTLAPRFLANNVLYGAYGLMARTNPLVPVKYFRAARRAIRDGTLPTDLRVLLGDNTREVAALDYLQGRTLRRLINEGREKVGISAKDPDLNPSLLDRAKQFSMHMNSWVDDTYRAIALLHGQDKALAKGLSREQAVRAGLEMARSSLYSWADMTPFERSVLRHVMPFYGAASWTARYALSFPMDHPVRTSIMVKMGQAEAEDWQSGLPAIFQRYMFIGKPDALGDRRALNLPNPLADIPSYFKMSGFLGKVNPVIAAVLEQAGVVDGEAELWPDLSYNPTTGRFEGRRRGFLSSLVGNAIPQAEILGAIAGFNTEISDQMRRDPRAAMRTVMNAMGIPQYVRTVDVPEAIIGQQIRTDQARTDALNEALRSGNWGEAMRYEELRPILEAAAKLNQRGQYTPPPLAPMTGLGS